MSYLRGVEVSPSFPPFAALRDYFGFVPYIYRLQTLVPHLIEAEAELARAVLVEDGALSRIRKESILLAVAAANRNLYCVAKHYQTLQLLGVPERQAAQLLGGYRQAGLSQADEALLDFAIKLAGEGHCISQQDLAGLGAHGLTDEALLEVILVTAWANFLCTLSVGLGAKPDFESPEIPNQVLERSHAIDTIEPNRGPFLRSGPDDDKTFAFFREEIGFVPNLFRAQTLRPEALTAEAGMVRVILLKDDLLNRVQKERILLVVSAVNCNAYCVAVHSEILGNLGIATEHTDQVALDYRQANLSVADEALLDFARKLASAPAQFSGSDVESLRSHGFRDEQVLEAVAMTAFTNFLNTVQFGLGAKPDFAPRLVLRPAAKIPHLSGSESRPTEREGPPDPDAESVAKVQRGDLDAFEELILRHSKRVYRTLIGILGNPDDAQDAMQDTFLKAFQHLAGFEGRSKFSTWLTSIASNTGLQRLRERKPMESLDDDAADQDGGFRPRQIRAWTENPEQLYSRTERRSLVEDTVMKLPAKYRVVVVLRDMEQLSTEETAAALGLGIPAVKSRLIRGRMMVREALAPHFLDSAKGVAT